MLYKENHLKKERNQSVEIRGIIKSGPLPTGDDFAKDEMAVKGAGERLLTMAEKQVDHRIDLENKTLNHTIFIQKIILFIPVILIIIACFIPNTHIQYPLFSISIIFLIKILFSSIKLKN